MSPFKSVWTLAFGLNMFLVLANIQFFAFGPCKIIILFLVIENISLFAFVPRCFILVPASFIYVGIDPCNM